MNVRRHIFFRGRVQGVGFRFTCKTVADRHDVGGWVRNLGNGSVEMIVEGESSTLDRYIEEVCESTHGRVDDIHKTDSESLDEFDSMQIRY